MRVGVCGLGLRIAHVLGFMSAQWPNLELVGYVDPQPFGLDYLRDIGMPAPTAYPSIEELAAQGTIDMLMVGSPNHLHIDHIRQGLVAGLRVFTEKPVVIDENQTFELLALLREFGADRVMVGLVLRYSPLYKALCAAVADNRLGALSSLEASEHITPEHGAFFMRDWRRKTAHSGGYMLEKCCHDLDLYNSIVGSRPKRVASFGGRRTFVPGHASRESDATHHRKPAGWAGAQETFTGDADIVDHQVALIEYESGVSMSFHANLYVPDAHRHFCIVGLNGMAEGDFERNYLRVHDSRTYACTLDWTDPDASGPGHYGAEPKMVADLHAHLADGVPLPVTVIEALETGLLAMKIDEARRTGRVLDLVETWQRFDSFVLVGPESQRSHA